MSAVTRFAVELICRGLGASEPAWPRHGYPLVPRGSKDERLPKALRDTQEGMVARHGSLAVDVAREGRGQTQRCPLTQPQISSRRLFRRRRRGGPSSM